MGIQTTFKRYELKYILTKNQCLALYCLMNDKMRMDKYGHHKIRNIYFDTNDYRIIRHSLDKPSFKEKLRVRCYGEPKDDNLAFIELKKKYNGVVYKRRMTSSQKVALSYLCKHGNLADDSQIAKEIRYYMQPFEQIKPAAYVSYEREAFYGLEDEQFRMTFDYNIKARDEDISLNDNIKDLAVLDNRYVLLEVKTTTGLPSWFLDFLASEHIYKTSFSKYGKAYQTYFMPKFINQLRRND
ncbi:MAG: polyphosphate polymerase domain-containing protein [Erysipelotrichaceae bacterium]